MRTEAIGPLGQKALTELAPRLAAIPDDAARRPHADPHAAATTALLVADVLAKDGVASAAELGTVARAILALVVQLGGEYLSDAKSVPGDLFQRAQTIRANAIDEIEKALPNDADVKTWLDAVRLGSGVVDLVYDLRTLVELHSRHAAALPESLAKLPATLRSNADSVEFALRAGESADHGKTRATIAKLWTMFVPAYEAALKSTSDDKRFPPLALIAGHKRARRKPAGVLGAAARRPLPPSAERPPLPAAPPTKAVAIVDPDVLKSDPPPPPPVATPVAPAASFAEMRREPRHLVELEVTVTADATTYLGFTENLSSGGVFVATYAQKRIGSKVTIGITLPDGEAIEVPGVIRWMRQPSGGEGWPGIGVQFEAVPPQHEERLRKFLSRREPLFYDD